MNALFDTLPPTRSGALARLSRVRPAAYARTRNHLDGAVTGLSPYLTHGLLTLPEVLAGVLERGPLDVQHKLVFELGWRAYFRHVWAQRGDGILESMHAGPLPEAAYARTLPADVREARTGVPVIDQAVRMLYATGTLHNHARMWLASYVVHQRHVHWRAGADWMIVHLLDGDLASNHLSWQWVAGTASGKPYLFNADNVARHAPEAWHSARTVLDASYTALERRARQADATAAPGPAGLAGCREPAGQTTPPADLGIAIRAEDLDALARKLAGRPVWLLHPWALRRPPPEAAGAALHGVYVAEHHRHWSWSDTRWRWVDAAMAGLTPRRVFAGVDTLATMLAAAAEVRSVDDPHLPQELRRLARLDPAPALFPPVARRCDSFTQWWRRATDGLQQASELLA